MQLHEVFRSILIKKPMIIYGTKPVHIKSAELLTYTCDNCNTIGKITLTLFRTHFHLFWIPIFPLRKKGVSHCQHCNVEHEPKHMPAQLKSEYDQLKKSTKGPIWQFSGLAVISLLVVFGIVQSNRNKERELSYLAAPAKSDLYTLKIDRKWYTTLKVIEVTKDSVFVSENNFQTDKLLRIRDIDKEENYTEEVRGLSRNEVREMYNEGTISSVKRKI